MQNNKTIKVDFRNFHEGFNKEKNFFIDTLRKKYNVVLSDNPDYLFYSVYIKTKGIKNAFKIGDKIKKISPHLHLLIRKIYSKLTKLISKKDNTSNGNFIKILYSAENTIPDMNECDWAFSSFPEELVNSPKYIRIPYHRLTDYPFHKKTELSLRKKIDLKKIRKEKSRFCNFIYSQDIPQRNDFFKKLNAYKKVDAPGRCMNNMSSISNDNPRSSRLSKNWVKEKLDFLKKYRFTIAFENAISPGWVTEKLTHPLLVNSIPIYVGTKTVANDFNTKCFINYNDFKNMDEFIKHIIKVDNDDSLYEKYLREPIFNNKEQQYFSTAKRIAKKILEIIDIEESKKTVVKIHNNP